MFSFIFHIFIQIICYLFEKQKKRETVPQNDVLVVISNPNGKEKINFYLFLKK